LKNQLQYSGVSIPPIADADTLVITAADANHSSWTKPSGHISVMPFSHQTSNLKAEICQSSARLRQSLCGCSSVRNDASLELPAASRQSLTASLSVVATASALVISRSVAVSISATQQPRKTCAPGSLRLAVVVIILMCIRMVVGLMP
jgi:hypothetical protein